MKVLLIGCGKMGMRHLNGLSEMEGFVHIVDENENSLHKANNFLKGISFKPQVKFTKKISELQSEKGYYDAAILSATANGRLERFNTVVSLNIRDILLEKPLEQSLEKIEKMVEITKNRDIRAYCNLYRPRSFFYREIMETREPFSMIVSGGAFGLGCNGSHYIDLALNIAKDGAPKMIYGNIDEKQIESGRGLEFNDWGGKALYSLNNNSSLYIDCRPDSSAPIVIVITFSKKEFIIDMEKGVKIVYRRKRGPELPVYRYGAEYDRECLYEEESIASHLNTRSWIQYLQGVGDNPFPSIEQTFPAFQALFNLLETSGKKEFNIT